MSLTYCKIKNLSNNWNSFCQRWALVTCSPAVKVEFLCLCPKHSEHTWQSDPAFHREPSPHLDREEEPSLSSKTSSRVPGYRQAWTFSPVHYKWDWSHRFVSYWSLNSNQTLRTTSNTDKIPTSDLGSLLHHLCVLSQGKPILCYSPLLLALKTYGTKCIHWQTYVRVYPSWIISFKL